MADNSAQAGTDTIATDDVTTLNGSASSGVKVQRVKVLYGDDNTARDVSAAFPLPTTVVQSGGAGTPVSASITAAGAASLTGTASTAGSVVLNVATAGNVSLHLLATAFVGTVVFEQSMDPAGGTNTWAAVPMLPEDGTTAAASTVAISTAAAYIKQFTTGMFGPALFRVRCSVFTSGTLAVYALGGPGWVEPQPALAPSNSAIGHLNEIRAATATATTTGAAAAATLTLAAPGAGLFHYITGIRLERFMTAAGTAVGTLASATTTNLGGLAFSLPSDAAAIGTQSVPVDYFLATPLKAAAAATATTISTPAVTATTYRITASYFIAA